MSGKKIHKNSLIGQQGINLIEKRVLEMGFVWYPTGGIEAGTDGIIELRDSTTGNVFNSIIQVQSKATESSFQAETSEGFDYLCKERDLDYWLQGNAPVILVVSRPRSDEAYWVSIKDYFQDLTRRGERKVHFDKQHDRFDQNCGSALAKLAMPQDAGIYLSPPPRRERLWSNLLEVTYFAEKLYIAHTKFLAPQELRAAFRVMEARPGLEWLLKNKQIFSFHNLEEYPWREICDTSTLESFDTSEWAYSQDADRQREFVWLLNKALQEKIWPEILYSWKKECYYVRATRDLSPRTFSYQSLAKKTNRTVFQGYPSKRDSTRIAYYRHSAFEGQFRRFDNDWYLEITPTYYFTSDGHSPSEYSDELLKGIKMLERNPQVLGQIVMWARYLSKPADLFTPNYPFLAFGQLESFDADVGIDDRGWLGHEEDDHTKAAESELDEFTTLFNL